MRSGFKNFLFLAEWAELNHRDSSSGSDVIESGSVSGEVAMDTGNPWDSKPLAASTVTPFDNPFDSPAKSGGGINPKVDEGWANFSSPAHSAQKEGTAATKTLDEDSEMSPVKADFEAAFGSGGSEDAPGGVASAAHGVPGSPEAATNQDSDLVVTSSPKKSPTVTTTEENIP